MIGFDNHHMFVPSGQCASLEFLIKDNCDKDREYEDKRSSQNRILNHCYQSLGIILILTESVYIVFPTDKGHFHSALSYLSFVE